MARETVGGRELNRELNRVVALRLSVPLYRQVRERARLDDRPLSAYLRRMIAAAVAAPRSAAEVRDGR